MQPRICMFNAMLARRYHFEWQSLQPLCQSPTAAISHGTKPIKAISHEILMTAARGQLWNHVHLTGTQHLETAGDWSKVPGVGGMVKI